MVSKLAKIATIAKIANLAIIEKNSTEMKTLLCMVRKEMRQFFRNSFFPKLMVLFPLAMMLVFPWAATQEVRDLSVVFVDHDHTPASRRLLERCAASPCFRAAGVAESYPAAEAVVRRGGADIILEVAADGTVMVAANAVNGTRGLLGAAYLQQALRGEGAVEVLPFSVGERYLFNLLLDYKRFMVPAMLTMLLTLLAGFLPALNIVAEKESGTIEQLNVSPIRRWHFIFGKLLPYWLMGFAVLNFALLLAYVAYGFAPAAPLGHVYAFAAVFIAVVGGLGLLISNYSGTMQQAMFVMFFFMLVFMLMSGLFTPVASMPGWAQWLAACNPLRYFVDAMRMLFLRGSTLWQLAPQWAALLLFAAAFNLWAVLSYRKIR